MKPKTYKFFKLQDSSFKIQEKGQAALIIVIFMLAILLSAVFGVSALALREAKIAQGAARSRQAFFAAEAGLEDAVYRLRRNKNITSSFSISLNGASSDTTVTSPASDRKVIESVGNSSGVFRALRSELTVGAVTVNFFYGVQVGDGGLDMGNNAVVDGSVYSNGNITGANGATITGDATVAGGVATSSSLGWTTHDSDFFFATNSGNRDVAQSFTANESDNLTKLSVYLGKVGNPGSNLTVRLTEDNGESPKKSGLASTAISPSSVGNNPSWIDASFSSPPAVVSGVKYWIVLDYGTDSASDHWNWRIDSTDGYAGNTGKFTSNCCSGNPSWTNAGGDFAFEVWLGGIATKIEGMIIGDADNGTGRANAFSDTTIHGSLCPNEYCLVENPPRENLPISEGVIQDWRDSASAGGICAEPECDANGNFIVDGGETISLGPKRITGMLKLDNNSTLILTGTVWVEGEIVLSNGCRVELDPSYGELSEVLLTDDKANISNNCTFGGSGDPKSSFMLLSAKNSPDEEVITVDNNAVGVIYYASNGTLKLKNEAAAKEATAYRIRLDNGAVVTYEEGLANAKFTSGPSGGWDIDIWRETE